MSVGRPVTITNLGRNQVNEMIMSIVVNFTLASSVESIMDEFARMAPMIQALKVWTDGESPDQ